MRKMLMMTVAMMGLAAAPAFAQSGATQTPASPNAGSQMPQPANSAPVGAAVPAPQVNPAGPIGSTAVATPVPQHKPMRRVARARPVSQGTVQNEAMTDQSAPPTSTYRGGVGSPLSTQATNLAPGRSEGIGSRLPDPTTSGNTPRDLLAAADRALSRGQTGAAQQALEMAETRILSRTTDPSMAGTPDQQAMVRNISGARRALGARDVTGARQMIAAAMNDRVPGPGPALTMVPPPGAGMMPPPGTGMAPKPMGY